MHGTLAEATARTEAIAQWHKSNRHHADITLCPPSTLLHSLAPILKNSSITLGAQDCHWNTEGAHTGDISPTMVKDTGCTYVIVGHSERRAHHNETDVIVRLKAEAAIAAGLTPILCVGESLDIRESGSALTYVEQQLRHSLATSHQPPATIIAYEPIWAIGTGKTASTEEIESMHNHLHAMCTNELGIASDHLRVLYGGSVKPGNAKEILALPHVGGVLVGGCSLSAEDFTAIIAAA